MIRAHALTKHRALAVDPKALFRATGGAVLFETGDQANHGPRRSILVPHVAVRLEIRGPRVRLTAVSVQGRAVVAELARALAASVVEASPTTVELEFPRAEAEDDEARLRLPTPLDAVRALVSASVEGEPGPFAVFAAVLFTYDLVDVFEVLPPPDSDPHLQPDAVVLLAESVIVVDARTGTVRLFATAFGDDPTAIPDAARRLAALEASIDALPDAKAPPRVPEVRVSADLDDAAYAARVVRLKEHITAGDVFQIVLSRTFSAPCVDVPAAYARLAASNPSPYQFLWSDAGTFVFGASPEAAVRVTREEGSLRLHLHPIAGTRPRGASPDEDDRIEAELRLSEKEVAEHMMLVDLARNDVARVSVPGTRRLTRLLTTERYSHVMHLVSEVTGTLRPGLDALHAYAACANMGTLVGAPKVRAAELLRAHELGKRGIYGGAIGWLSHDGTFDSAIVIRSAFVRDGVAYVRAGAGIVDGSDPAAETDETRKKAQAVLRALGGTEADR